MSGHEAHVEGDYRQGWYWICTCGTRSSLHGETSAPRRGAREHVRTMLKKAAQS